MGSKPDITRRDFLNGVALSLAAGTSLSPIEILAKEGGSTCYPPALTGLRGSHAGSFEVAHAVARAGARFERPDTRTDDVYDLVVVGGGISGLSAALMYRQRAGNDKSILVLDNHDDFGGHAKRNEFTVDGHELIGYGGSMSMDQPHQYSRVARQLLSDVGIETDRFNDYFDQAFFARRGYSPSIYFSADRYGRDVTAPNVFGDYVSSFDRRALDDVLATYPVDDESRAAIRRLLTDERDYLAGMSAEEKLRLLHSISYNEFLEKYVGMPEPVVTMLRDLHKGLSGAGWDAAKASIAAEYQFPGTAWLGLDELIWGGEDVEPYIHHFPDGNAGIARLLVRHLVRDAVPGSSMEDVVKARAEYARLDRPENACRIRLKSTAVDVRHAPGGRHVDVTYVRNGRTERCEARHAILACYNSMIPHICPDVPAGQSAAIGYAEKVPLVYINIAVRNWRAWDTLKTASIMLPQSPYMHIFSMDFPVTMGGYAFTSDPDTPTILHGSVVMTEPGKGLSAREQFVVGSRRLYEMSFDDHEALIRAQLGGALAPGGFDDERDIAAITVNRWPHGYAYEYYDPAEPDYSRSHGPHVAGRAQIGRISIANSDSEAWAYVDGAIDAAARAVSEQLAL